MNHWTTELHSGDQRLEEVNIGRGIFQGDCLSSLLFIIGLIPLSILLKQVSQSLEKALSSITYCTWMTLNFMEKKESELDQLVQTVRILSQEFGISKCALLLMKRRKFCQRDGIGLPNAQEIRALEEGETYKYLGVLEADEMKREAIKGNIHTEYFTRVRSILKSKLSGGNVMRATNSRVVSIIRYGVGIINWTKEELRKMDRKTRKLLTIHNAMHPQADVDRLYMKRAEGGRGLISLEECVELECESLAKYIHKAMRFCLQLLNARAC